ncbi:MAG: hypothetical protein ACODAG_10765 [Myxococcota bacterium]
MLALVAFVACATIVSGAAVLAATVPLRSARGRGRSTTRPCAPPPAAPVPDPDGCVEALVLDGERVVWVGRGRRHVSDWDAQRLELLDVPGWVDSDLVEALERDLASRTPHAGRA